ncbi:probable RNA-binding protein 19 isoform X1 [Corythoichthys intestinalis]|uniref:probable RNA-binding protein 19 isoform X1 n=1 Tax=Corythoichthys intestinalis TaxID=161448 RepID=UPI0025A56302|nr:probable RNA-binding protein 19 isoform X1 [Corythoichthys intestinalis]
MSRLIVKNLPNGIKEERFRGMFAAFGTVTDCTLKFTKDGKFRKFGFVGFKSEEDANAALKHFHRSFVDTSRVTVEMCKAFGDPTKAKAWSKHTQSSEPDKPTIQSKPANKKEKAEKEGISALKNLVEDEGFKEFLSVHLNRSQATTWANDAVQEAVHPDDAKVKTKKKVAADDYLNFDSDQSEEEFDEREEDDDEGSEDDCTTKEALKSDLSDMDYLRTKIVRTEEPMDESQETDGKKGEDCGPIQLNDSAYESGDRENALEMKTSESSEDKKSGKDKKNTKQEMVPTTEFTVKLRGVPFNVKEQQIREFMTPQKPAAIRIGRKESGNRTGYVYVDLHSEEDVEKALKKNNDYIGGRYIEVFRVDASKWNRNDQKDKIIDRNFTRKLKEDEEEEDVADSGRLFVRNLPYTCAEEDVKELFSKHGPLTEVLFPIDNLTKRPKGFAFITYMIPENAVTALAQLDGHIFQGRMLHLLPSTVKKEKGESSEAGGPGSSSYKRQKDAKNKASSSSSHNWNTLFLGTSAVADAIADKYNTTKSQVLDHETKGSVAVRMALGETQIVQETRQFLLDNGVSLDSFSQAAAERSTSVILVKNLPAGVTVSELEELFSTHGSLGRVLLPPSGLTAIIEFLEPTEAKRAFTRLAYSKFHHVPLYLEWAPVGVFVEAKPVPVKAQDVEEKREEEKEDEDEEDEEDVPGSTLFIKNLNFSTMEETLQETFSKCGKVKSCTVSKKKDKKGKMLSMGYGFVQYQTSEAAQKALRQLQHCSVDGHSLELKVSERATRTAEVSRKKKQVEKKQTGSKILVRNVPFQATVKEIRELFCTFGELKTVRLPKKAAGTGNHRGFGFIDFVTKQDAKKAFAALCHSTHLYGRRLVLEWADAEDTVETLRRKTAEHFHVASKKQRKAEVLGGILENMETQDDAED